MKSDNAILEFYVLRRLPRTFALYAVCLRPMPTETTNKRLLSQICRSGQVLVAHAMQIALSIVGLSDCDANVYSTLFQYPILAILINLLKYIEPEIESKTYLGYS